MNRIVVLVFMTTALGASEKIKEMNRRQAGKKIILYLNLFFCQIWVNSFCDIYLCYFFLLAKFKSNSKIFTILLSQLLQSLYLYANLYPYAIIR